MKQNLSFAVRQITGKRPRQEDSLLVAEEVDLAKGETGTLLVICDGMGGHISGELASQLVTTTISNTFGRGKGPIPQQLQYAADQANSAIASRIAADPRLNGMGTTLVAVLISGQQMYWYSVGDSPLWLIRDGQLRRLNEDHSMAALMEKRHGAREEQQQTISAYGRHLLMSAINGREPELVDCPDIPFTLREHDQLLLATDGIETLRLSRLHEIMLQTAASPVTATLTAIFEEINMLNDPQQDNASAILVHIGSSQATAGAAANVIRSLSPGRLRSLIWKVRQGHHAQRVAKAALLVTLAIILSVVLLRLLL